MTLQSKLERIGNALGELPVDVFHYWRPKMNAPFCVWAEDGEENSLNADNLKAEQAISGYVDYYTKTEYDPMCDSIQEVLFGLQSELVFGWVLYAVDYDDETNLIHYQWTWRVA